MTAALDEVAPPLEGTSRGRRFVLPVLSALGAAAFLTVAHVADPNEPGTYPPCPWLLLTGTYCPGCGTLRATHALTDGDVATAFARNPLTVLAYVVIFVGFASWSVRMWTGRPKRRLAPAWLLYALFWAVLAFWVARNVPGWAWLSPA